MTAFSTSPRALEPSPGQFKCLVSCLKLKFESGQQLCFFISLQIWGLVAGSTQNAQTLPQSWQSCEAFRAQTPSGLKIIPPDGSSFKSNWLHLRQSLTQLIFSSYNFQLTGGAVTSTSKSMSTIFSSCFPLRANIHNYSNILSWQTDLVMLKSLNIYLVLQLLCLDLGLNVTIFSPCNSRTKEYKCKEVVSKNL